MTQNEDKYSNPIMMNISLVIGEEYLMQYYPLMPNLGFSDPYFLGFPGSGHATNKIRLNVIKWANSSQILREQAGAELCQAKHSLS